MKLRAILTMLAISAAASLPLLGHHSFAAEFDSNKVVTLTGKFTKMDWVNPHSWIHLNVTGADGKVTEWMIEGGSPNTLFRRGINKDSLPKGTIVMVDGYQAKDGSNRANGRDITLSDGKKLFVGGSTPAEQPK